ncbi:TonB-linked outer membrane protein, SusC/RagA family [Filimonas lacunae]|uniref:TonB-linked outer membrane protein, SusC/RagA family n=1 Tax=Filimonas lacunae TaxID=477680 RepID=A0A1N7N9J1_9BACT|nr:SusC/RagA family TonB-linked outer membrane protein [Filimonas lacunae]SIS94869.1 TonB-linked outer membrane protein, SusC/RagA family [Filimonas lacunae]
MNRYIRKAIVVTAFSLVAAAPGVLAQADTAKAVKATKKGVQLEGVITDAATHKPAAGIRVQVDDYSAAITDNQGYFKLKVPSYNEVVLIEGEGYDSRRVPLKGRKRLNMALLGEDVESFHEQVTMPFGRQTRGYVTAAISNYSVKGFTTPGETADALLQGRMTGLQAIRRSGAPGVGANLFLRGLNSLYATNKPLIVIDGMLFDANEYGESIIANNYTNPLALIDAKDIDNITLVKDATSMYGTKGANGALIITTARAVSEATRIDFAVYSGFNKAPAALPVMNAADYRTYLSDVMQSRGLTPAQIAAQPYMNDDVTSPLYAQYHNNTNWQNQVLRNSMNRNIYLKITGGDNIATYGLTVGYLKNEGVIRNTDMSRYNTRFNAEFNFTKRFTGTANLSFTYNSQNLKDQGMSLKTAPLVNALTKAPFLHVNEVNEKGVVSPNLADRDTLGFSNPAVLVSDMKASNRFYRFFGSFSFHYEINRFLKASTLIGVQYDKVRENFFIPRKGVVDDTLRNAVADSRLGSQVKRLFSLYTDSRVEYNRGFERTHSLAARAGIRYQNNKAEQDLTLGYNSATDNLTSVQNGVAALRQTSGDVGEWNWMNLYASADYGFAEKLFLSANVAMDGSSRFGTQASGGVRIGEHKFPVMSSVGATWLLSSEQFMGRSFLNLLKLRASYSVSGNDDIGNYTARQTYVSQNLLGAQGLVRKGIANPALQWETSRKINFGLDVAVFNERVNVTVDLYKSSIQNMLVYRPILGYSGFENVLANDGKMQNTGLEGAVNVRVMNSPAFKWDAGIQMSAYKNKVLAVPNNGFYTSYAGATIVTRTGGAANRFAGFKTAGVYTTDAEAASAGLRKRNTDGSLTPFAGGDIRFADIDGNKIIDDNDRTIIGNPNPLFTGAFTSRWAYKGFELSALFTFSYGNDVYNQLRYHLEAENGYQNQLVSVNNRWRANGQVTNTPKAAYGDPMGNSRFSDRWIEDGSYLRLRTLSLQYNVPLKATGALKSATVFATGYNLVTFTHYLGYDPEFSATPSVLGQGIDTGLDPVFKSVTLGVKIGI